MAVGEIEIPSLEARFVVDPFSGQYQLNSDIITVNVAALPEPLPPSFTGAIGEFDLAIVTPNKLSTSNTIEIKLHISGNGNIEAIKPPIIQDTIEYRVLSVPGDNKNIGDQIQQQFDYVIIPKVAGILTIPGIEFSYFNKSKMNYITLTSPTFSIEVPADALDIQVESQEIEKDIKFLQTNSLKSEFMSVLNGPWAILIVMGLNIAIIFIGILVRLNKKIIGFIPSINKQKKHLLRQIKTIDKNTPLNEMEQILVKSLQNLATYSGHSLHPKEVEATLIKAEVSDPLVKSTMQWIKNAQILRYSKEKSIDQHHSNSESLKRILNEIYRELEQ